jgi:hypothetical protein
MVTGLFDEDSEDSTLLQLAACNQIELHATSGTWNTLLWMLTTGLSGDEGGGISGTELGEFRARLPVVFH